MLSFLVNLAVDDKIRREIAERLEAIFNTTGAATIIVENDRTISLANSEYERISGYTKHETEGKKKWTELIPNDYLPVLEEYHRLRRIDPGAAPGSNDAQFINKQGKVIDIALTINMIPKTKKSIVSFLDITDLDITEHKQAEGALRDQALFLQSVIDNIHNPTGKPVFDILPKDLADKYYEVVDLMERKRAEDRLRSVNQQLQDIIDFLPDATIVVNKDRKVIAWNKSIENMTGLKKEEMLGRGDYAYGVPFYGEPRPILIDLVMTPQKEIEDKYDYIIREGDTLIAETDTPFTYRGRGAILWGIATLLLDSHGNVIGAIESIRDITDQRNTIKALKLSEERFSQIFNYNPSLMFICTIGECRFVMVNNRFLQVTGYSREEIIGRTVTDIGFWAKLDMAEVKRSLKKNGIVNNHECIFREKSGETNIGLYSAQIMPFGNEQLILGVVNDISERKRLEEEMFRLESMNLIGEMAAGIGHEIRNPMTTIRGFLQILGEKQECSNFKGYFSLMIEELDRANSIITEYLSLARNKAVSKKYHNLNHIIKALYPLILADAMRIGMYVKMALGDIPDLMLDEKEIRQLILNMVRNGLEAMSPGGEITLRTFMEKDKVTLAIQDQGKGISQEALKKMGTPFFTTKDTGTGLGLAVCYSIALRQNASIRVETGPGGATFYVEFPIG